MPEPPRWAPEHAHDIERRVEAVASDLEYFRAKRLEPRALFLARRGVVTFYDLLRAHRAVDARAEPPLPRPDTVEARLDRLEAELADLVTGIAATVPLPGGILVIDDTRTERGDYHPFFRLAKRSYEGTVEERVDQLEVHMEECTDFLRVFTQALVDNGAVTEAELEARGARHRSQGYRNGARICARAWVDADFKERLLRTGREAIRELGIAPGKIGKLGIAENRDGLHNVVVCTLCSCYPYEILGDPPFWYRTEEYRHQVVARPRDTLQELFGLDLPASTTIRVHDSTSDLRWMVLPARPAGTEGMSEEALADLVTPESLVGTGLPSDPAAG